MEEKFWAPPAEAIPLIGESVRDKVPPGQKTWSDNLCKQLAWKIGHKKWRMTEFEKSIHKAYLQAIARAEDFIYIETQYLIGESKLKSNSTNRIPKAIVERILAMNRLQRDFHVYIVTPLYPEGDPLDNPVQPVRYNQWETMKWMKNQLANLQGNKQWTDYLSFYFLGQRNGAVGANHPNSTTRQALVQHSNRYMIYVHSKLMIVDDRWIILGSANLNERSMAGNRDSEICVAMWPTPGHQAAQTAANKIKDFRKELWCEHLVGSINYDTLKPFFDTPQVAATVTAIRRTAEHNFREFIKNDPDTTPNRMGHLMYWNWNGNTIDTGYLPDSPVGEDKLLWAPQESGLFDVTPDFVRDGFR
jgi:phospholipase D1/2